MRKLTLLFFILVSPNIFSQSGWEVIYEGEPYSNLLYRDITFNDDQTGWILCPDYLRKTTNSGVSWKKLYLNGPYSYLQCFYFYNSNLGWVVENNKLNLTSNGGDNWVVLDSTISSARSIFFRGIINGWLTGNSGLIKKSTNGGYNWITVPSGTSNNLNGIAFANDDIGACAGDWGTILSTTNGGLNWLTFTDPYLGFFDKVVFMNAQTGFVSGTGNNIYKTTNSGLNWAPYYLSESHITSIRLTQDNSAFAFGRSSAIFKSTNAGNVWNLLQSQGLPSNITTAAISPNLTMWAGVDSGLIYRSIDEGISWNLNYRNFITKEDLNSVFFLDNNTGYACGNRGTLVRSSNGGVNWIFVTINSGYNYTTVQFTDNNTGYVSGGNGSVTGIILKTTNSGNTWQTSYLDSSHFTSVFFLNNLTGWATGTLGHIIKTTNGGSNWIRIRITGSNRKIWFIDENTGFITRTPLYKSTNGGANWFLGNLNFSTNGIQFIGQTGYVMNNSGNATISKTTNSGQNWNTYFTGSTTPGTFYFIDTQTGWSSGDGIRKTTNGGVNWTPQPGGIGALSLFFKDYNNGWGVGYYGGIMRTVTGGIGIAQISSEIPRGYYLEQNYPNPFNPMTKLKFQIPKWGIAKLVIYDVTGRELTSLVNEELKPGTYEVNWDASNYSSGIYFYSLITSEFTQTRKMVMIK